MKKLLLGTSALVLSAGVASAEVVLGGDGYFGVAIGDDIFETTANPDEDTGELEDTSYVFVYDFDVDFTASGETDGGLVFGGSMDADEMDTSQGIFGFDSELFIQGDFGRLAVGDTDGGAEAIIGDLAGVGLTGLGDFNENVFLLGAGPAPAGPLALYTFNTGGISLALGLDDDQGFSIAAGYNTGQFNVGLGFESIQEGGAFELLDSDFIADDDSLLIIVEDDTDHIIGAVGASFANVDLSAVYGQADFGDAELDQYGLSATATFGAIGVSAFFRQVDTEFDDADDVEISFAGLGAEYDLGGGASLVGGVAFINSDDLEDDDGDDLEETVADFGIAFSF